jgi:hypothetical protein
MKKLALEILSAELHIWERKNFSEKWTMVNKGKFVNRVVSSQSLTRNL